MKHEHRFVEEQQTKHRFCGMCGRHDPPDPRCADRPSGLYVMLSAPDFGQQFSTRGAPITRTTK